MSPVFSARGVSFRLLDSSDLGQIKELRNDFTTWAWLSDPIPITSADQKAWYENLSLRKSDLYFVVYNDSHPFIGLVGLSSHDVLNRSINVKALYLEPKLRRIGYGLRIIKATLDYCFKFLNIHRVWASVLDPNEETLKLHLKIGGKVEGRWREAVFRNGKYMDLVLTAVLENEYKG